jgi:hypothetical protein
MMHKSVRLICLIALAAVPALAACGSDSDPGASAPKGSPENPLVAEPTGEVNEGTGSGEPGYQQLVDEQSRAPQSRFTPCNLVTQEQARAIVGAPLEQPLEARQGPTCIYRSRDGESFITVAVQQLDFGQLKGQIRQRQKVDVGSRAAYCGNYGQPMLYLPLRGGDVLSVAGQCEVARKFAATALPQLLG